MIETFERQGFGHFGVERKEDGALVGRAGLNVWDPSDWSITRLDEATGPIEIGDRLPVRSGLLGPGARDGGGHRSPRLGARRARLRAGPIALIYPDNVRYEIGVARNLGMEPARRGAELGGHPLTLYALREAGSGPSSVDLALETAFPAARSSHCEIFDQSVEVHAGIHAETPQEIHEVLGGDVAGGLGRKRAPARAADRGVERDNAFASRAATALAYPVLRVLWKCAPTCAPRRRAPATRTLSPASADPYPDRVGNADLVRRLGHEPLDDAKNARGRPRAPRRDSRRRR